jgi:hypothetical protein
MAVKNWGIWRAGFFKNLKFLFTGGQRVQEALVFGEQGTLSIEHLPMAMGFFSIVNRHMSWLVMHKLKSLIKETGHSVLEITERSYIPTDPYEEVSDQVKEGIKDLSEVALTRYIEKRNSLISGDQEMSNVKRNVVYICFAIIIIILLFSYL